MDELIKDMLQGPTVVGIIGIWQILAGLMLSFFLSMIVVYFYRETHQALSYSTSFVQTMIIMGVTVSIIMVIIGSNIARAFALVGALSIIRFRTAVKEPRDVAFIFMTMAIGMATGTGFYLAAVVFTIFGCAMVYFLYRFNIGSMTTQEVLLKIHLPENLDYHSVLNNIFFKYLREHSLISVETIRGGTLLELVYAIQFKSRTDEVEFLGELRTINGNNKVALLTGQQNINV